MAGPSDEDLKRMARDRAGFKTHAAAYVAVNVFLWALWFFSEPGFRGPLLAMWPLWATFGWGLGLAMHAFSVYGGLDLEAREEARLRQKYGR